MKRRKSPPAPPGKGAPTTRRLLIEVAGQVFAEKGFGRATAKDICARAKVNAAAVNYHFGSFQNLYAEVLCEAHRRVTTVENLQTAVEKAATPQGKLAALVGLLVGALTGPVSSSWVLRVLSREIVAPSPALAVLRQKELLPKSRILRQVVARLMNLPENHPAVSRGCMSVFGPIFMLLIADRTTLERLFPSLGVNPENAQALTDHLVRFALAALRADSAD